MVENDRVSIIGEHFPEPSAPVLAARPRVGTFCAYVPEEVLHACGAHPVHVDGQAGSSAVAGSLLPSNLCPYVRSCLNWATGAEGQSLEGVVFTDSCNAMQRLRDIWGKLGTRFVHLLDVPRIRTEGSHRYFAARVGALGDALASHLGAAGWRAALPEAVALYGRTRALLGELAELRRSGEVELLESEHLRLLRLARRWDRADFNERLARLLAALRARGPARPDRFPRILLTGSMSIHEELVALVEAAGARVVHSDLCTTSRYYRKGAEGPGSTPVERLAAQYLDQIPCARMKGSEARMAHLEALLDETGAEGVIVSVPQFCDTFLFEYAVLRRRLAPRRIRDLLIESDYAANNGGQLRTKIEAFVEMLGA